MDEDVAHRRNGVLPSPNKEWTNAICSNKDATRDYHTVKSDEDKYRMISLICGI